MKRSVLTIVGAAGVALMLSESPAYAGFGLADFIPSPQIWNAETYPPVDVSEGSEDSGGILLDGLFCPDPRIYQGTEKGFKKLETASVSPYQVEAYLDSYHPGWTYKIGVVCKDLYIPRVAVIDVTIPKPVRLYYIESEATPVPGSGTEGGILKLTALCDEGDLATGGGFDHQFAQENVRVLRSQHVQEQGPIGSGWVVWFINDGETPSPNVRTKAVCADFPPLRDD